MKTPYRTRKRALEARARNQVKYSQSLRVYRCDCGQYHITSQVQPYSSPVPRA